MFRKKAVAKRGKRQLRSSLNSDELNSMIQERAYSYFEQRGYQEGNDLDDWLRAEDELKRELGIS